LATVKWATDAVNRSLDTKIIVSVSLLGLAAGLYAWGMPPPATAMQLGMSNTASVIVGANLTYWFKADPKK
jgi:hypothetical protein